LQQIVGGTGNDILTGGADGDIFDFEIGFGSDVITDFEASDVIRLSLGPSFDTFDGVVSAGAQVGDDLVFDFGQGDRLILQHATMSELSANGFLLT
jgi:Ca2+-binding RTX toxin-like protein